MQKRPLISIVVVLALLGLCWSGVVERAASAEADQALKRVLIAFGVARTLNGLISAAQGTEIAVQPAGVGVTLTAGEILDPLNDLVERFSLFALAAAISLGAQQLLTELLGGLWVNLVVSALAAVYIATVLARAPPRWQTLAARTLSLALIARLGIAVIVVAANGLGNLSLAEREEAAIAQLTQTQVELQSLQEEPETVTSEQPSGLLDRISGFIDEQTEALDVRQRMSALQERAEQAVSDLVMLCVLFLLQYLVLPLGALWLAKAMLQPAWQAWWLAGRAAAPDTADRA